MRSTQETPNKQNKDNLHRRWELEGKWELGGNHWVVDKKIPLALIFTLLVQSGLAIWWARGQVAEVDRNSERIEILEKKEEIMSKLSERVLRLEITIQQLNQVLQKLDNKLENR